MKEYSTFLKAPRLQPQHQAQFGVILKHPFKGGGLTLSAGNTAGVLFSQPANRSSNQQNVINY